MALPNDFARRVLAAARDNGTASVLFRNAISRKLGLNVADSECLSLVAIRGLSTPTELGRHTGLSTGATTAMLDRLEKKGFVTRRPNPDDRRGVLIEVSDRYRQAAAPLVAGVQKAHDELLERYSQRELEIIADFLTRFRRNVAEQTRTVEELTISKTSSLGGQE